MKKMSHKFRDSPAFQRAYFAALHNSVKSGEWEKYYHLLTDYNFLSSKIRHPNFGLQALINDYDLTSESEIEIPPQKLKVLKLIQGALQISSHVLKKDTTQLSAQLWGRLLHYEFPEIKHLLESAKQHYTKPWLRPFTPSLNPAGGRLWRTLTGHCGAVLAVAVTPDGEKIISASKDKTLKIWNLQTGEEIRTLKGHTNKVTTVAVTPDGTRVVSGSWDDTVRVWNLETEKETETGKEIFVLSHGYCKLINAVVVTPDSKKIISASSDFTLVVWSLETGNKLFTLSGHKDTVSTLAITPDGKRVLSGSWDKTIRVWSIESNKGFLFWFRNLILGREVLSLKGNCDRVTVIVVTPDGKHIISDSLGNNIKIWDLETGKEIDSLKEHTDEVNPLAVTPDAKWMISGSEDNTLKIWSLGTTEEEAFTYSSHNDRITDVKVASNNKQVISISKDHILKIWSLETGNQLFTLTEYINQINSAFITLSGKYLVVGDEHHKYHIWDIEMKEFLFGKQYLKILNSWNLEMEIGDELRSYPIYIHNHKTKASATSPNRRFTIFGLADKTIRIWNNETQKLILTFSGYSDLVNSLAISPDGKKFIAGFENKMLKVYSLETSEELFHLVDENYEAKIAVTPNGQLLISSGHQNQYPSFKVWNLSTGEELFSLGVDDENTLKISDYSSHKIIASFTIDDKLECFDLSPDGKTIVAGDESGKLHFLYLEGIHNYDNFY